MRTYFHVQVLRKFFITIIFLANTSILFSQEFTLGWYSPLINSCETSQHHSLGGTASDTDPEGPFASVGINTLLAYKQEIQQVYIGNVSGIDLQTHISNTIMYINEYPSSINFILDISPSVEDSIFLINSDVQTYIESFGNNNRVLGWYIADEPDHPRKDSLDEPYYTKDFLISRYNYIKSISNKPVFVVFSNSLNFKVKFSNDSVHVNHFYDILMADCYPIKIGVNPYDVIRVTRWQAQQAKIIVQNDSNHESDLFYFVAQGVGNNKDNNNCSSNTTMGFEDFTQPQIRYMVLSPMIWGAKGILFWSYRHTSRRGLSTDTWKVVHQFAKWFTSEDFHGNLGNIYGLSPEPFDPTYDENMGIHYRFKYYIPNQYIKELYIFSVNEAISDKNNRSIVLPIEPILQGYYPFSCTEKEFSYSNTSHVRDVPHGIQNNRITSDWAKLEVKIFKIIYIKFFWKQVKLEEEIQNINVFNLKQNSPNPFNPSTKISFDLPTECTVSINIYDITGRQIKTLTSSRYPAGTHQIQWNGTDDFGNAIASGIYVYRIQAGNYVQSKKMMLLK